MKKLAIAAVSCIILASSGCSNTSVRGAKSNLTSPISKVCVKHVDGRGSLPALEPMIAKAFNQLGYKTDFYNTKSQLNPKSDCSHIVSYQVKAKGPTAYKFNSNLYIYYPESNNYERVGNVVYRDKLNSNDETQTTSILVDLYGKMLNN